MTIQSIKELEAQYAKECVGKPKKAKELKKVIKAAKKQVKVLKKALRPIAIKIRASEHGGHDLIVKSKEKKKLLKKIALIKSILAKKGLPKAKRAKLTKKLAGYTQRLIQVKKEIRFIEETTILNTCKKIAAKRGLIQLKPMKQPKSVKSVRKVLRKGRKLEAKTKEIAASVKKMKRRMDVLRKAMKNATPAQKKELRKIAAKIAKKTRAIKAKLAAAKAKAKAIKGVIKQVPIKKLQKCKILKSKLSNAIKLVAKLNKKVKTQCKRVKKQLKK